MFTDAGHAQRLSDLAKGTVRADEKSSNHYVRLGAVRSAELFADSRYGHEIYQAIATAEKDRLTGKFRKTEQARLIRPNIPPGDDAAGKRA